MSLGYEHLAECSPFGSLPQIKAVLPYPSHTTDTAPAVLSSTRNPGPSTSALGGTFDHLHAAHKLLLHLSLFLSTRKLIVGIMSDSLLSSKSNSSLVQPLEKRVKGVEDFLSRCGAKKSDQDQTGVVMDVVEIHDAFGPTAWDEDIDALVVSTETRSGGEMVNKVRKEKGLGELELFIIDVIASNLVEGVESSTIAVESRTPSMGVKTVDLSEETDEKRLKDLKMGSTAIRQWLASRTGAND
jgi:pantetheine-phosphate adenylyltransferase